MVIGAGLAGLAASRMLADAGRDVRVIDKGRSVGGRMATRRIDGAVLDHGAQFFTVREERFDAIVAEWTRAGVVREWCRGFDGDDGHPRHVGTTGMTGVAKHMSQGLDIECATLAFAVVPRSQGWTVQIDDGRTLDCDEVVVTCPVPQAYALLHSGDIELPEAVRSIDYERTLGLLVTFGGEASVLPPPGGLQNPDDVFSFVGDNVAKGISSRSAVTFHANPRWSAAHFDDGHDEVTDLLLGAARRHLGGAEVATTQLKKWRFATPTTTFPERCWVDPSGTLALAGDAFAGPRVEGAVLSGLAAAETLLGN